MRRLGIAAAGLSAFLVAACCPTRPSTPVTVEVPGPVQRVAVPDALTRPCVHQARPATVGELLAAYEEARAVIAECSGRMEQIRALR